ncbi:response regulator transcription factor [Paenibacillus kribbensis]|uniref:response regulator transcription factor n=1 Tax=Paenibacillus kribbensis TaxID=172713 RepID=UPI002DBA42EA|nr:response regulator transcription factor [Paenibacillus kribbensis]MEC0236921.1 response regulator transcription factor [Paenibacillus kribbensis]
MKYRILIADDETEISELLQLYLEKDYEVYCADHGHMAWEIIQRERIHLAILDIMMPGIDGLQLLKKIRKSHLMPVLFLSARTQASDKVLGLGLGADDYIAKPFNPLEVVARVEALIRRAYRFEMASNPTEENIQVLGDLVLDRDQCTLFRQGNPVALTYTEYKIMDLLMSVPGRVFTRKRIYESVWEDYYAYEDSTIMVHISNIREKIEQDPRQPQYLKTIRGLGYKIEASLETEK